MTKFNLFFIFLYYLKTNFLSIANQSIDLPNGDKIRIFLLIYSSLSYKKPSFLGKILIHNLIRREELNDINL